MDYETQSCLNMDNPYLHTMSDPGTEDSWGESRRSSGADSFTHMEEVDWSPNATSHTNGTLHDVLLDNGASESHSLPPTSVTDSMSASMSCPQERISGLGMSDIDDRLTSSLNIGHRRLTEQATVWVDQGENLQTHTHSRAQDSKLQDDGDHSEKIKTTLLSAWNNMKFGWKTNFSKTNFRNDSQIWLLGMCYACSPQELEEQKKYNLAHAATFEKFRRDFISRIWFTYRKDFRALYGSSMTTDVGWGCMLRTGQMMMAHAFILHFLGREWRWHSQQKRMENIYHHQIIRYFGDDSSEACPLSLHKLVKIGVDSGRKPGDWYGPASVAHVLREAMEQAAETVPLLSQVALYVAQDCTVYKQDVIDQCTRVLHSRPSSTHSSVSSEPPAPDHEHWRAIIILIPIRLGGETLNPIYIPCLQSMLASDFCLGIIGGRPKHSLYFIGFQDDKLIHLDPHLCQDAVDVTHRDFPLQSYHCLSPRKMPFSKMDPSCTIGFYCRSRVEFDQFIIEATQISAPPKEKGLYPMFVFQDGRSIDVSNSDSVWQSQDRATERYLRVQHYDHRGNVKKPAKEADDFVFL